MADRGSRRSMALVLAAAATYLSRCCPSDLPRIPCFVSVGPLATAEKASWQSAAARPRGGFSMPQSFTSSSAEAKAPAAAPALCAAVAALFLLGAPRRKSPSSARVVATSPITMFARTPFPTTPIGSRGKRRQRAGRMRPIFRGRQIAVRVNMKTNKPIKYHMHVRPGDVVQVMKGKDAGKVTEVLRVFPKWNKILCLGVNYCIKHVRPTREDEVGSRVQVEAPMHASGVMHYSETEGVAGNLGIRFEQVVNEKDGKSRIKKIRFNKATGEAILTRIPNKWVPVLDRN